MSRRKPRSTSCCACAAAERITAAYEAYAEIVLLNGAEARAEPRAIPAADVLARLGPRFRGF